MSGRDRILRLLPAASRRTQLLLAGLVWTAVGLALPAEGLVWSVRGFGLLGVAFALPFLAVGLLKARVLDRVTRGIVSHILERDPEGPFIGFMPLRTWLLVPVMIAIGSVLRHLLADGQSRAWLGFAYVAVGSGLLVSSRILWRKWREHPA